MFAFEVDEEPGHGPKAGDRLLFFGDDDSGRAIEVIAVDLNNGQLLIIHAMPLRKKYLPLYEEEAKWQST